MWGTAKPYLEQGVLGPKKHSCCKDNRRSYRLCLCKGPEKGLGRTEGACVQ